MSRIATFSFCLALSAAGAVAQVAGPLGQPTALPSAPQPHTQPPSDYSQPAGNAWFEKTQADLGLFYDEEEAVGSFKFTNPKADVQQLSKLQPSCTCTKAIIRVDDRRYEIGSDKMLYKVSMSGDQEERERVTHINVEPGEEGEIEVHMAMHGARGPKQASLTVQTTDEELPVVGLHWRATGAEFFRVDPPDVNLNEMAWGDEREFEFTIRSPLRDDFNLLEHEPLSKGMTVAFEKEMAEGKAVWRVKGKYGPEVDERDNGGVIRFKTDIDDKTVTARVIAYIKGPLTMKPGGFVSLGHVRRDKGKTAEVTLSPNGDFDLQVEKLEIAQLRGVKDEQRQHLHFEHAKDGSDIKVTIRLDEGMEPAYINGVLKIHLNHPAVSFKEVMFNGFVR
ncbi:MAG: hypothetical protein AAF628_00360 [Planctomycetota bacterium]